MVRAIVTDIEGTTSSIAFVHQTLFPYARRQIGEFLRRHADQDPVREQIHAVSALEGKSLSLEEVIQTLCTWIDADKKATPLKALQGMIWAQGYASGELKGHIYEDAVVALRQWHAQGLGLYVYSSGSVQAQQLIFGHTEFGDLTPLFAGYYDTRIGHKQDPAAYAAIAADIGLPAADLLFLSDVGGELDAAASAGLQTWQLIRPGEGEPNDGHRQAVDFGAINPLIV